MKQLTAIVLSAAAVSAVWAEPIVPTREDEQITVRLILGTARTVREECANLGITLGGEGGCAKYDGRVCTVYAPKPTDTDDPRMALVGHEVLHCFRGAYHGAPKMD